MFYAQSLNAKGEAHLKEELKALNLDWDIDATIEDISNKIGFQEMRKGHGDYFDYEISYIEQGKSGYGANHITFTEEHIKWEKVPIFKIY